MSPGLLEVVGTSRRSAAPSRTPAGPLEPPFELKFKALIRDFGLVPAPASKYRAGLAACGLDPGAGEVSHA